MRKKLLGSVFALLAVALIAVFVISNDDQNQKTQISDEETLAEKRQKHQDFIDSSPYKETITWDKKKRKNAGLPPNKYFEQMWELTINPATGRMEDGKLSKLREEIRQQRQTQRTPGESANPWVERGPNNVGGRTRVIMFDPNDASNNTVFAGGVSGGLWKNTNISSSSSVWQRVENIPGNLAVSSITVDPRNSNRWYVGTGEQYTGGDVVGNGVYMTTDGGNSWNALNIPAAGPGTFEYSATNLFLSGLFYVNDVLAWDNGSSTELFVAVGSARYGDSANPSNWLGLQSAGLYRSTDGGSTWGRIETSNMQHTFGGASYYYIPNDLEVGADNKLWMGTIASALGEGGGRVFSSTNGGSWTEAGASPLADSNRVELEPSATNPNKLYALTQGNSAPVHIYSTTNGFGSITSTSLPNDADTGISANDFCRGQAFYDLVIEADPANDNIVYVGGIDLFKSTNGGSSWGQLSHWYGGFGFQNVHADQHSIAFGNNSSSKMLFGNDGGVYYSGNAGGNIGKRVNGYNVTQYVKAGIGPNGASSSSEIFTAGAQDNGSQAFRNTTPGINSGEPLSDGDGFYTFVDKDGQYMIATYVYNVIYRFSLPWNGLGRLQGGATSLENNQSTGSFVNEMGYDSDGNRLLSNYSSGTSYAVRSINVAANSKGTLTNSALNAKPTAFRASPYSNNTWHIGTATGGLLKLTNVTNTSANWSTINTPFVGSVSSVRYGANEDELIVTMHNYGVTSVWYTNNGGANWTSKEGNLPNLPVRDVLVNPLNPSEAILATQLGTWRTANFNSGSPEWSQAYNGMQDVSVTAFDYWNVSGDHTENKIIASTYGRGVFTGTFTATTVPDTEAPSAPSNLTASNVTEDSVELNWTVSTDNVGVTAYDVYQGSTVIATVTTTDYTVTDLTANTDYTYSVKAKDDAGNESAASNTVNVTTLAPDTEAPSAPSNLTASNITATGASLAWNASTDNVGVTAYDVFMNGTLIATVTGTTYNVTGLASETTYNFTVKAKDAAGNVSDDSNTASVTTDTTPITYCSSSSSNVNDEYISRVRLNTIDNSSGGQFYSDFTNVSTTLTKGSNYTITINPTWTGTVYNEAYDVWIDYNRDGDFTDAGEKVFTQAATNSSTITGSFTVPSSAVENATRMRITMQYNRNSAPCDSFTYGEVEDYTVVIEGSGPDVTAPSAPTNLNASNTTQTSTDLSWTASTDNVGVTAYDVYQGGTVIGTVASTSYSVTGLTASTTYSFTVRAKDAAGNVSTASNTASITTLTPPDTEAPTAPTNLSASNITDNSTDLSWSASTDNTGVTGYDVLRDGAVVGSTASTSFAASGLSSGTTYSFTVRAKDAAGNVSANSNSVSVTTTQTADTTAPTAPTNLTASNTTETTTDLSWTASTDNVGVTGYDIYSGGSLFIGTVAGTTANITGMSAGTTYSFYVVAKDAAGNASAQSNTVTVTTDATPTCDDGIQNGDETGVDCGGTSCAPCQTAGPDVLNEGFFESGWDGWVDGGSDCRRISSTRSYEGSYSIRLRDNSGTGSAMTLSNLNLTPYNEVEIEFYFYAYSMENNEDFWVRYYNGSSWTTVATYARGQQFDNNTFYTATVVLNASQVNFATNSGFRFQCDASGNNDQVYIDQVVVRGYTGSAPLKGTITPMGEFDTKDEFASFEEDFMVYPNPVQGNVLNVVLPGNISTDYRIMNMLGATVRKGNTSKEVDITGLEAGMYFIEVNDGDETLTKKFIRR